MRRNRSLRIKTYTPVPRLFLCDSREFRELAQEARDETFRIPQNQKEPRDGRHFVLLLHRAWPGLQRANSKGHRFSDPLRPINFPDAFHHWIRHDPHPLDMEHG